MDALWRYGAAFCNSFLIFGVYYFVEIPTALENAMTSSTNSNLVSNTTKNQPHCTVCLGLGEVRYNLLFSVTRWTAVIIGLPSGVVIDKIGNCRSAILFTTLVLIGSILFTIGATSHPPVTTPMYILMVVGYASLAFGDTSLRITQTRIVSHCFTEATLFALVLCLFGYAGQGVSLFLTPFIATTAGFQLAVWTGPISCLIGVICAVGLTVILQRQSTSEESKQEQTLTLNMLKSLPYAYWMIIPTISLLGGCWVVRQANLPDYLELQHGYTSEDASRLTSISPFISLVLPFFFCVFNKLDCDGILSTSVHTWMTVFCVIIGFCPNVNVIFTLVADGIGIGMFSTFQWQLIVVLCPAAYLGTLGGLLFMVRNSIFALTFIAAGYTLQRGTITDIDEALLRYHRFFIMLICMSVIGILCGVLMNIVDYRQDGKLNGRMRSWKQSELENIGLISMGDSPDNYNATGRDCIDNT